MTVGYLKNLSVERSTMISSLMFAAVILRLEPMKSSRLFHSVLFDWIYGCSDSENIAIRVAVFWASLKLKTRGRSDRRVD